MGSIQGKTYKSCHSNSAEIMEPLSGNRFVPLAPQKLTSHCPPKGIGQERREVGIISGWVFGKMTLILGLQERSIRHSF